LGLLLLLGHANATANRSLSNLKMTVQDRWMRAEEGRRERCQRQPRHDEVAKKVPKQSDKRGAAAQSLLELDPSLATPGAGSEQTLAGPKTNGQIDGHEVDEKAWKDGYAYLGCLADAMVKNADKFGDNADRYNPGLANVSIVWYSQHVMKNERKSMTHKVCFEFCRGVEHMVFFGILKGDGCYCMPYYTQMPKDSGSCDVPCPGQPSTVCGGKSKSSIFSMHFCNDAATDLIDAATEAGSVLAYFEREAWLAEWYSVEMQHSGEHLEKIAGLGGDPVAADWGQQSKEHAGELKHAVWDGECYETFHKLQDAYHSAKETSTLDLWKPANLDRADTEILTFKGLSKTLYGCAAKQEKAGIAADPTYVQWSYGGWTWYPEETYKEWEDIQKLYVPLQYGLEFQGRSASTWRSTMSSCGGKTIGKPMILPLAQCAAACEEAVHPQRCVGYQHYSFSMRDGFKWPICVLLAEITLLAEYECRFLTQHYQWVFLQEDAQEGRRLQQQGATRLRGGGAGVAAGASDSDQGKDNEQGKDQGKKQTWTKEEWCDWTKTLTFFYGLSCKELFWYPAWYEENCPEVCSKSKGVMASAGCFARQAEVTAGEFSNVEIKKNDRCFGGEYNRVEDQYTKQINSPEPNSDAPITSGPQSMKPTDWWTPKKRLSAAAR